MKSWIILIVLAVVLTAAATFALPFLSTNDPTGVPISFPASAKPDGPAPAIEVVENPLFNFGVLPQRITGHHTWTIKNSGLGPLELRGAKTDCSCTTAALFTEKKDGKEITIKPGESLPLEITFETKDWNTFHQNVTIATNDPAHPTVILTIDGVAKPAITTVPGDPSMGFGLVANERETTRRFDFFSGDRPDVKILKATSTNPDLLAINPRPLTPEEAKAIKAEKGYRVEVVLKPTNKLGPFSEEVLIETDHPHKSEIRFRVVGTVTGPITFVPDRVNIRGATSSDGGTAKLKIVVRGRTSVKFDVQHKPEALNLTIEPIAQPEGAKGSLYWMNVKVIPGSQPGRIVDEIVLKTDDPLASELKVPVDFLIEGAR